MGKPTPFRVHFEDGMKIDIFDAKNAQDAALKATKKYVGIVRKVKVIREGEAA